VKPLALGPPAIAIHDDGDVAGDFLGVQRHGIIRQRDPPAPGKAISRANSADFIGNAVDEPIYFTGNRKLKTKNPFKRT
jgi:hypothetical protein